MTTRRMLADWYVLLKRDFWALILGGALAALVGSLSLGLLSLPTAGGLRLALLRRVREGRPMQVGDVFAIVSPFGRWLQAWLAIVGAGVAIGLVFIAIVMSAAWGNSGGNEFDMHAAAVAGFVAAGAAALLGLILGTLLLYTATIMADDREASLFDAIGLSCRLIIRGGYSKRLWLVFVMTLVGYGGRLVVAAPLALVSLAFAWRWSTWVGFAVAGLTVPLRVAMYLFDHDEAGRLRSAAPGDSQAHV